MISKRATDDPTTGRERAFLLEFAPRFERSVLPLIQACKGSRRWRCRTGGSRKGMRAPELSIFQVRDYGDLLWRFCAISIGYKGYKPRKTT